MRKEGAALRAALEDDAALLPELGPALRPGGGEITPDPSPPPALMTATGASGGGGKPPPPPVIPAFTPVPRRYRHDGWTPERQKAFIEALADTGCVDRAARMVNIAQTNCYTLRRAPGAEEFRRAWDAALDFGLKRVKDVAFQRAIEGEMVPVFVGGKLMGFRRKYNDALLMFILRHYGQDGQGKRTTINYFSTRASAGAVVEGAPPPPAAVPLPEKSRRGISEASTTTVRTVITGPSGRTGPDEAAAAEVLNGFEGVELDEQAQAEIARALEECAERARAADEAYRQGGEAAIDAGMDDPDESFVRVGEKADPYRGALLPPALIEDFVRFTEGEPHWSLAGAERPEALIAFEEEMAERKRVGRIGGEEGEEGVKGPSRN